MEYHEARAAINNFAARFDKIYVNGDHVVLIQLAAFPVAMTVHLLYQLWANFRTFNGGCTIDALAVNDCIHSNLFRQTGPELFEMDAAVRHLLLSDLRAARGDDFLKKELATFLYQYSRNNTKGRTWKNFYEAQQWTAIMEVNEKIAAEEILRSLADELSRNNVSRGLGIANLISALGEDNVEFTGFVKDALQEPSEMVSDKRVVVTDTGVEGKLPVKINLPPALSRRLKKFVTVKGEGVVQQESVVYGWFTGPKKDRKSSRPGEMSRLFVSKGIIKEENVLVDEVHSGNYFVETLASQISRMNDNDVLIIYYYGIGGVLNDGMPPISPGELNILISKRRKYKHSSKDPEITLIITAQLLTEEWQTAKDINFILLTTGFFGGPDSEYLSAHVLYDILNKKFNITYRELWAEMLSTYYYRRAGFRVLYLPYFIINNETWERRIFSREGYYDTPLYGDLLKKSGYIGNDLNKVTEQFSIDHLITIKEDVLLFLKRIEKAKNSKWVNCLCLSSNKYMHNMFGHRNRDTWEKQGINTGFFEWKVLLKMYVKASDDAQEGFPSAFLEELMTMDFLFIGINELLTEDENNARFLRTIINISRALNIRIFFFIEDDSDWRKIPIKDRLLHSGREPLANASSRKIDALRKEISENVNKLAQYLPGNSLKRTSITSGIFIGISSYEDGIYPFQAAAIDAVEVLTAFEKAGLIEIENIHPILEKDATKANVIKEIEERLSHAEEDDVVVIYFKGHAWNRQHNSALYFYDYDTTEKGVLTDIEFNYLVKSNNNNSTIVLILDADSGGTNWLDVDNPKHYCIMASWPDEVTYNFRNHRGMLSRALIEFVAGNSITFNYNYLQRFIFEKFIFYLNEGLEWQTPMILVHADSRDNAFLKNSKADLTVNTNSKYNHLKKRSTIQCVYYSNRTNVEFTLYNTLKKALHKKHTDFIVLDSWPAFNNLFTTRKQFPDVICIGLHKQMNSNEVELNIEKLLYIASVVGIPVYLIHEDDYRWEESVYQSLPSLPADHTPVMTDKDVAKLIVEIEVVIDKLLPFSKPAEKLCVWSIAIGIDNYPNFSQSETPVKNVERFNRWVSSSARGAKPERIHSLTYSFFSKASSNIIFKQWDVDNVFKKVIQESFESSGINVLYLYINGRAVRNGTNIYLCLPGESRMSVEELMNINGYIDQLLAGSAFNKIVVLMNYSLLVDSYVQEDIGMPRFSFPLVSKEVETELCLIRIESNNSGPQSAESNILLSGLKRGAVDLKGRVTSKALVEYIEAEMADMDVPQGKVVCNIRNGSTGDFKIASLNPKISDSYRSWSFKNKWISVVGTGNRNLTKREQLVCDAVGQQLAEAGYGLITGGWPGVDTRIAKAYSNALLAAYITDKRYLIQITDYDTPEYKGGHIERIADGALWTDAILNRASALIIIGGAGGAFEAYMRASRLNMLIIPVPGTGGDALKAYNTWKKHKKIDPLLAELDVPVRDKNGASNIALTVIKVLRGNESSANI